MEKREDPYEIIVPENFKRLEIRFTGPTHITTQIGAIGLIGTCDKEKHTFTYVPADFTNMDYVREQLPEILGTLRLTNPDVQILFF
jgi:hypothetical protein